MPDWIAKSIIVVSVAAALIALGILCQGIWIWLRPIRQHYGLRLPVYRRDKPNPLQWLLDQAEQQCHNPTSHLVVTDRIVMDFTRDARLPQLWIRLQYQNLGVHNLLVSVLPDGVARYRGETLPDSVMVDTNATYGVPPGAPLILDLHVFIPTQFVTSVSSELDTDTGEIRQLDLSQVLANVRIQGENQQERRWSLSGNRIVIRPNR